MSNAGVVKEVSVDEAWQRLAESPSAVLLDVRTRAEWAFVGVPDLARIGKQTVLCEWQSFPDNRVNPRFLDLLGEALGIVGADRQSEIYVICRSGGRSMMAARVMTEHGYAKCFNVIDGFEGPLDGERHRGRVTGWKARGLPWQQG